MFVSLNSPLSSVEDENKWGYLSTPPLHLNFAEEETSYGLSLLSIIQGC